MQKKQRGSIHPFVIIILLIFIAILLFLLYLCCTRDTEEEPLPECSSGALFSVLPLNDDQYTGLLPLGSLNPPGHTFPTDHHYFYLANPDSADGPPPIVPVRMPGDAWITEIATSTQSPSDPPYTDYTITFKPCENYEAYFGHISDISAELHAELSGITPDCHDYSTDGVDYHYCRYRLRRFTSAGTNIGTAGGHVGQWALDFGAHDFRQAPLQWVNQTRIETGATQMPYTACPSEMFTPALKTALEARFSGYSGVVHRTIPPLCGQIDQDVPGTAQGIWFRDGIDDVYPEDPHLALVHDNVDPAISVISMGTSIASATGRHSFSASHSGLVDREFDEVTPGDSIYCYNASIPGQSLLLRLMPDTQLRVEYNSGADCSVTPYNFTGSEVTFVR